MIKSPADLGIVARPDLPKPRCRVILVCGPVAAGKSTYVDNHREPADIVIDLDLIAREFGYGRNRPPDATAMLLAERNKRLAALATELAGRTAWVIIGAPSQSLREWWREALNVKLNDVILLQPSRDELRRRIMADPDRVHVRDRQMELVDQWLERERSGNPGVLRRGHDASGNPTDPLHSWNRK